MTSEEWRVKTEEGVYWSLAAPLLLFSPLATRQPPLRTQSPLTKFPARSTISRLRKDCETREAP